MPRDESVPFVVNTPDGRWINKPFGRAFNGSVYHLYQNCQHLIGSDADKTIEATDDIIDLLRLGVCTFCNNRAQVITVQEVMYGVAKEYWGQIPSHEASRGEGWDPEELVEEMILKLGEAGFRISGKGKRPEEKD
jgi:hypothetical protein